jgi:DNA polymerase-3 subunit gamma/tau
MAATGGGRAAPAPQPDPAPRAAAPAAPQLAKFDDIVLLAAEKRDIQIKHALEQFVRPVRMQEGRLEIALAPGAPVGFVNSLGAKLHDWTGKRWVVILSSEQGAPTVRERKDAQQSALESDVRSDPLVQTVLQRFPGAEIVGVRRRDEAAGAASEPPDFDSPPDMPPDPPDDDPRD